MFSPAVSAVLLVAAHCGGDGAPVPSGTPGVGCSGADCVADAGTDAADAQLVDGGDLGRPDLGRSDGGGFGEDVGAADLGALDLGVLNPCAPAGSACVEARDCETERAGPSNCPFCPSEHRALCLSGACVEPPLLDFADVQEVAFQVTGNIVNDLEVLVGVVIARETSGGARLDCADVLAPDFDLTNACYNVLTSRLISISQASQTYTFTYGRFPSGQDVLLIVYGFDGPNPAGDPLGVTCTEHSVGAPRSGRASVPGNPMIPL